MKSKFLFLALALGLAACSTPKLPEPTVKYPTPPTNLMKKPAKMETIKS